MLLDAESDFFGFFAVLGAADFCRSSFVSRDLEGAAARLAREGALD